MSISKYHIQTVFVLLMTAMMCLSSTSVFAQEEDNAMEVFQRYHNIQIQARFKLYEGHRRAAHYDLVRLRALEPLLCDSIEKVAFYKRQTRLVWGDYYLQSDSLSRAVEYLSSAYDECVAVADQGYYEQWQLAETERMLGMIHYRTMEVDKAVKYLSESVVIFEDFVKNKDFNQYNFQSCADVNYLMGVSYQAMRMFDVSEKYLKRSVELYQLLDERNAGSDPYKTLRAQNALGVTYYWNGRYEEALQYEKPLVDYLSVNHVSSGNVDMECIYYFSALNLALLYEATGVYDLSDHYWKGYWPALKDFTSRHKSLQPMLYVFLEQYSMLAKDRLAIGHYVDLLNEAYLVGSEENRAQIISTLKVYGLVPDVEMSANLEVPGVNSREIRAAADASWKKLDALCETNDLNACREVYLSFLKQIEGDDVSLARAVGRIADVLKANGQYHSAERYYKRSYYLFCQLYLTNARIFRPYMVKALYNLGQLALDHQRYFEAQGYLNQAHDLSETMYTYDPAKSARSLAEVHKALGDLYAEQYSYAAAEHYYRRTLQIYESIETHTFATRKGMADTQSRLAMLCQQLARLPEAEDLFDSALALYADAYAEQPNGVKQTYGNALEVARQVYTEVGRPSDASKAKKLAKRL